MQFRKAQRAELLHSWNGDSWFFRNLGLPARKMIEVAYGLGEYNFPIGLTLSREQSSARTRAQEDVSQAMAHFARALGCDKSHTVHALLSGSVDALIRAVGRATGQELQHTELRDAWEQAFRSIQEDIDEHA